VIASDKYWVRTASPKFRFGPIAPRLSATPTAEEAAFAEENPRHHLFHYTDVPIQQSQYRAGTAGTRTDDVVQVITHAVNVLRGRAPNHGPAVLNERNALWLLAHLVGDVHQPLHVGTIYFDSECEKLVDPNVVGAGQPNFGIGTAVVSSRGGNELKIGNGKDLHSYWDSGAVLGAMRLVNVRNRSIEDFVKAVMDNPPRDWEVSGDIETWSTQWATETMPIANSAITRVRIGEPTQVQGGQGPKCTWPVTLSREYTRWANQQALNQLGKAGFRLAALLRVIVEHR
jgi:hypothetical protein